MGRLTRLILEYVANAEPWEDDRPEFDEVVPDPRVNRGDRQLLDWVKEEMQARGYPEDRWREILDDLRGAIRRGGPIAATVDDDGGDRDAST